jgi:ABC-type lipoprotein release transport system permease subunit
MNLAVVAGAAITTAVVTGALLVGDSMRESLRQITLERLGDTDRVLLNERFFDADLADRLLRQLASQSGLESKPIAKAIILQGSIQDPSSGRRASSVELHGIDETFSGLFPGSESSKDLLPTKEPGQIFPSVVINEPLQEELGVDLGDDVLVYFGRSSDIPTVSLLGRREEGDLLDTLRLTVSAVVPARGPGRFGLQPQQTRPLNAFVDISLLQRRLDRPNQINALLVPLSAAAAQEESFEDALSHVLEVRDLGLEISNRDGYLTVESRELVIRPEIAARIDDLAAETGAKAWPVLTYLANQIEMDGRTLPYSTVTALSVPPPRELGEFLDSTGSSLQRIGADQIALSTWAADDLQVVAGDIVSMTYYLVGPQDELISDSRDFEVGAIVQLEGLAADPTLTPELPGVSGADDMSSWDPPFPVDLDLVRPQDEQYWDDYGATPKAFLSLEAGQDLWRSRYGEITSYRLVPAEDSTLDQLEERLHQSLPTAISPTAAGFVSIAVRQQGLDAASGTSDFSGLFAGFSLFLIVASVLLVVLLFTLLVEQRAREAGLLLALGYQPKQLQRRMMFEGGLLAVLGSLAGVVVALLYANLVLTGLENWWAPVVEAAFLRLHVRPTSLLIGATASVIMVLVAIFRAVRRVSRIPARRLLAGEVAATKASSIRSRRSLLGSLASLIAGAVLLVLALATGEDSSPALFFGIGASLVAAGIASFSLWCSISGRTDARFHRASLLQMAARNSARHPGRSLLSVGLVASASFVLVSVTANRKDPGAGELDIGSGIGGLTLVAESDISLPVGLRTYLEQQGPEQFSSADSTEFFSLRLLPGEDASCLNLYQPEKPRVLGIPEDFASRNAFSFRSTIETVDNPWTLLDMRFDDDAIPAIGDYNSVLWILHLGLGKDLVLLNDSGNEVRLRLVGLLDASIFQSEVLISEENFVRHFPNQAGYGYFMASVPTENLGSSIDQLEELLAPFGFDGTLGLGVVLLRNVIERQGELATLRAFGFRRRRIISMVVAENAFLLAVGLAIGAVSGIVAVAPHLATGQIRVPWQSLGTILITVFGVGLLASIGAVVSSLRIPLLPALKAD